MLVSEFIDRTGYQPTAEEYAGIEQAYYVFEGDKDAFCRAWCRANPHKTGTLWAAIKQQQRIGKVFDRLANYFCRLKMTKEQAQDVYYRSNYAGRMYIVEALRKKVKAKSREELRYLVKRLSTAAAITSSWDAGKWEYFWNIFAWV